MRWYEIAFAEGDKYARDEAERVRRKIAKAAQEASGSEQTAGKVQKKSGKLFAWWRQQDKKD